MNKELWKEVLDIDPPITLEDKQREIIRHYGEENQLNKLIEECSELIQAICKYKDNTSIFNLDNMVEEMADVTNIIEQVKLTDDFYKHELDKWKTEKVDRQLLRIREE